MSRSALTVVLLQGQRVERVPRALSAIGSEAQSLVVLAVPVPSAGVTAVRLLDGRGRALPAETARVAVGLSRGGRAGLAELDAAAGTRSWTRFVDGVQDETLTEQDELWLPHDAQGMPDLDAEPVATRDGVPDDWRRLRSCLDLGMQGLSSCRFTPVVAALEAVRAGEPTMARAWVLREGGRTVAPAAEVPLEHLRG
jgi:hypothetical protein